MSPILATCRFSMIRYSKRGHILKLLGHILTGCSPIGLFGVVKLQKTIAARTGPKREETNSKRHAKFAREAFCVDASLDSKAISPGPAPIPDVTMLSRLKLPKLQLELCGY